MTETSTRSLNVYNLLREYGITRDYHKETPNQREKFYKKACKVLELVLAERDGAKDVYSFKMSAKEEMDAPIDRYRILSHAFQTGLNATSVYELDKAAMGEYKRLLKEVPGIKPFESIIDNLDELVRRVQSIGIHKKEINGR